jgi:hypothetical protein
VSSLTHCWHWIRLKRHRLQTKATERLEHNLV